MKTSPSQRSSIEVNSTADLICGNHAAASQNATLFHQADAALFHQADAAPFHHPDTAIAMAGKLS